MEVVTSTLRKLARALRAASPACYLVEPSRLRGAGRITTGLWPGFPSDLVSLVTVLATQAEGARWCTTGCTSCGCSRWSR